ncbi:MAG: DegT/DnrJ/EryC1/StrS family aminotransferase [Candidatus Kuenenia sp.]|nr:DegT/DnrJ/EryC1/StrS family aminotransferase [Candidatus Kuenenia hertensis]
MMWKIPLSDINFDQKEVEAVQNVIYSGWLTMGDVTKDFEARFARYIGVEYAFAVSSCTSALHLAALALDIGEGDEVVCPSLTFVAAPNSIIYTRGKPVFADITSTKNLNISPEDIEKKITTKTKAIQIMHYAGIPCNMESITDLARKHDLPVIEDCAHSPGAKYKGKKCGSMGNIGCFSFFSNKNMTTGEGGMITTNDESIAKKIRTLRSHGMTTLTLDRHKGHAFSYDVTDLGFNYRLDEIHSAIGIVQLEKLQESNEKRLILATKYQQALSGIQGLSVISRNEISVSSNHILPVLLPEEIDRAKFMGYMKQNGIQTSIHYPPAHLFDFYRRMYGYKEGMLPLTEEVSKREVTLPLYPSMNEDHVNIVCEVIREYFMKE